MELEPVYALIICDMSIITKIWWIGWFPQNLAWIHAAVSEKPELMNNWCLHHDSSSADSMDRVRLKNPRDKIIASG